jgi:hypothetical protein
VSTYGSTAVTSTCRFDWPPMSSARAALVELMISCRQAPLLSQKRSLAARSSACAPPLSRLSEPLLQLPNPLIAGSS